MKFNKSTKDDHEDNFATVFAAMGVCFELIVTLRVQIPHHTMYVQEL